MGLARRRRVFAVSDVHADHRDNMSWVHGLSADDYGDDVLVLAGDISDDLQRMEAALASLRSTFSDVFFVPGNHDLWVRTGKSTDSAGKFRALLRLCDDLGVRTSPGRVEGEGKVRGREAAVWVVGLLSWYVKPEENADSLFVPKPGEDPGLGMWSDNYYTDWSSLAGDTTVADWFLDMNEKAVRRRYDAPVISFSHFLPRRDLIFSTNEERSLGRGVLDRLSAFNFSRVAGTAGLERQLRTLGSTVHVYGHQHRNRHRLIEDVLYVSHCLGYEHEREAGVAMAHGELPRLIWDSHEGWTGLRNAPAIVDPPSENAPRV